MCCRNSCWPCRCACFTRPGFSSPASSPCGARRSPPSPPKRASIRRSTTTTGEITMRHWFAGLALSLIAPLALAQGLLTEKKFFTLPSYTTQHGKTIKSVRVGYETYGKLNAAGDNAIFIAHFFSGTSHAAGRYKVDEKTAGYWDAIIGPGKAIDTEKYFVVSADTLVNVNVPDSNTVTTGPASINRETGRPWGMTFPVIAMRDFVEVQKTLLDSLRVTRLALVAGPSNGGLQTIEWAAAYPDFVQRAMPVIAAEIDAWMQGWLDIWEAPIRLDPNWRDGDYYGLGREPPLRGLAEAWKVVTLHARDRPWAQQYDRKL